MIGRSSFFRFQVSGFRFPHATLRLVQLWTAFLHTGVVGKTVLTILLLFSVMSWATMIVVAQRFRRSDTASRRFTSVFRKAKRLADVQQATKELVHSSLV